MLSRADIFKRVILKTPHEMQSGCDRQRHAELLIEQLPEDHDGRNTWLLNYGRGVLAETLRVSRGIRFDFPTQAAETVRA
jgi:hypothetical protein